LSWFMPRHEAYDQKIANRNITKNLNSQNFTNRDQINCNLQDRPNRQKF
jgi:hypothetical protein